MTEEQEDEQKSLTSSETEAEEEEEEEVSGLSGKKYVNGEIVDFSEEKKPDIRKSGTIIIKFSERVFPSPARESTFLQEQEVRRSFFFFLCTYI